jgi:hypothetical protein
MDVFGDHYMKNILVNTSLAKREKRHKSLKTQSRECLQVDVHFLKDHTIDIGKE